MPFDGVESAFGDRLGKIDKVIDLLASPEQWCKGTLRTPDGRNCIRGAIMAVDGTGVLQPLVLQAINEVTGRHYRRIESFNDHPDTDHGQVVTVLTRTRDRLMIGQLAAARSAPAARVGWRTRLVGWFNGRHRRYA
jgi:hypothetical protein